MTSFVIAAFMVATSSVQIQSPPSLIPDGRVCASCIVTLQKLVVLGERDGQAALTGPPEAILLDSKSRYWILQEGTPPLVFDRAGRFLQTVGRQGAGPGEFSFPTAAVWLPGDSVLIIDRSGPRATVVSPELRPGRSIRLQRPLGPAVALDWPSVVVMNGLHPTPEGAGWPLHRVSFEGNQAVIRGSFGPEGGELLPGRHPFERFQQLARSRSGRIWSADMLRYRLHQWTQDGTIVRSLERRPEWFSAPSAFGLGGPRTPPPPAVTSIYEDSDGLVWVFVRVAAASWRMAWGDVPADAHEVERNRIVMEKLFATVIEVIDPSTATVVARRFVDDWIVGTPSEQHAAMYSVDANGVAYVSIYRIALARR